MSDPEAIGNESAKPDARRLPKKLTRAKRRAFLMALEEGAMVGQACKAVGVTRQAVHKLRKRDPEFAQLMDEHMDRSITVIEDEITRRGVYGVDKPIVQGGKIITYVKEYSDQCLLALAKRRDPTNWKDRSTTELVGAAGGPVQVQDMLPLEVQQRLTAILARSKARQAALQPPAESREGSDAATIQ
jgi:hypothetical protein